MANIAEGALGTPRFAWKRELGRKGELLARDWLVASGCRILHTNWRSGRFGEIDIVARNKAGLLIFCEVKTRVIRREESEAFRNEGFEAVDWRKRRKIMACARNYIVQNARTTTHYRMDVIVVEFDLHSVNIKSHELPLDEQSFALLDEITPQIHHVTTAFY